MRKKILHTQEKEREKVERLHMLQYPGVCQLFIVACICADAFTLYSVFDVLLTQQPTMTIVITVTVAAAMNLAPMLLAACIRNSELSKKMKRMLCVILTTLFVMLFATTFALRFSSQEQLYGSSSEITVGIQEVNEEEFHPTVAQSVLAVILGVEPLATSICSFVLAYEVSPTSKRRRLRNLQIIELEDAIQNYEVMQKELEEDIEYDLKSYDYAQYKQYRELIIQQGELVKNQARRKLTEYIATPEAITLLMESENIPNHQEAEQTSSASEI